MDVITTEEVLQQAARWHARLHAADCTDQDRIAFEQWRRGDDAHARAFLVAERTSRQVTELALADPRLRALARLARQTTATDDADSAEPAMAARIRKSSSWKIPAALAASVAIAVFLFRFVPDAIRSEEPAVAFESPADSMRNVTLADGSAVQLDVGSRILVDLRDDRRLVTLVAGRAVFEVAHDRSRPFSVTAAQSRTTALGTRFQVQLDATDVVVTLAQGSVAIDNDSNGKSSVTQSWHEQLQPGEQLRLDTLTAQRTRAVVDPGAVTSWTRGRHLFRSTPLLEAIDEVNRYARKKVRLGDPSLADLQVGGNFIAGDSELIVAAFAAVLPLSVVEGSNEIILFRRHDTPL